MLQKLLSRNARKEKENFPRQLHMKKLGIAVMATWFTQVEF